MRGYSALAPFLVYFRKGSNEYKIEGGTVKEPSTAPKPGTWLVFERQPVLRFQDLPNQMWAPPRVPGKPQEAPKGWAAMTDLGLLRTLLA